MSPRPFLPSPLAHATTALRQLDTYEQPGPLVHPGSRRLDERNPLYRTGAEALLAQPPFLLNRQLNETDYKYYVAPGGQTYYLHGHERDLVPYSPDDIPAVWTNEPRAVHADRASDPRMQAPRPSARAMATPPQRSFVGHEQTVSTKFYGSRRSAYTAPR